MSTHHRNIKDTIESLLDTYSAAAVVNCLQLVAYEKAKHLASNWQDHEASRQWERLGGSLDKAQAVAYRLGL